MIRALVMCSVLGGCELTEEVPQDPRCPKSWDYDISMDGNCRAPDGYVALLYAQFGGSGIYGFARGNSNCLEGEGQADGTCGPQMLADLVVEMYRPEDVNNHEILLGATPVAAGKTAKGGVYKMRIAPGEYTIACIDPYDGLLVTGAAEVKTDAIALYAIDLDHRPAN